MAKLIHTKWFYAIVKALRLRWFTGTFLEMFPITRALPSGIRYRIRSPENFSTAAEIFREDVYAPVLESDKIRTFIDLGSNTGYVACLLADRFGKENIQGVLVDANPEMVRECEWHIAANGLTNCKALWGLVGPTEKTKSDFHINDFNIISTARTETDRCPLPLNMSHAISVPVLQPCAILDEYFGSGPVDFLKIDIEGSEVDLLNGDLSFMSRIRWLAIEWHKWEMSFADVQTLLEGTPLELSVILKEDTICGLALFSNRALAAR